jgi:4-alpha-glucanotransferase
MSLPTQKQWDRIGKKKRHGIALPITALRSKQSCGLGEFLDLIPLIDWCKEIGLEVIQLLPLNDSATDPSPYNPISSCALNPLFLSLHALQNLDADLKQRLTEFTVLSQLPKMNYSEVEKKKIDWLWRYFEKVGKEITTSAPFENFVTEHSWIQSYAAFKDKQKAPFYSLLQYLSALQLLKVKQYAVTKGVLLMGDIPILVSAKSVDVALSPQLFDQTLSAGAPPDDYNHEGQYWGFPLFNWDALKKENYAWWKQRLKYASLFYDIYRIDHVVGFFRIWGIPINHSSRDGKFIPENQSLWMPDGRERLEMMINSSLMLPIAEDLGTVSSEVRVLLAQLGICGTKVMRWERKWQEDKSFIPIQDYPELSLTCVSTHDSPTLELWWRDFPQEAKVYAEFKKWSYSPQITEAQRKEILRDSHHTNSLFHINLLQETLALFPELVWPDPEEERINIPGKFLPTNWTYRFRPTLEQFMNHDKLKMAFKDLIN